MSYVEIRLVEHPTDAEVDAAVNIFARAFKDEHIVKCATGGKPELCDPFFRSRMEEAKLDGRLYLAISHETIEGEEEEKIVGAAYWTIFDTSKKTPEVVQKLMSEFDERLEPHIRDWWHSRFIPPIGTLLCQYSDRVWHLKYLGVLPEYWRRGIGKALVLPLRDQAKAEGWNFSLVTQTLDNVRVYEKLGFRIAGALVVHGNPFGDITAYVMVDGFAQQ